MHSDGGISTCLLFPLALNELRQLRARLEELGATDPLEIEITAIFNLWAEAHPGTTESSSPAGVLKRVPQAALISRQRDAIERLELLSTSGNATIPRVHLKLQYTAIGSEFMNCHPAIDL